MGKLQFHAFPGRSPQFPSVLRQLLAEQISYRRSPDGRCQPRHLLAGRSARGVNSNAVDFIRYMNQGLKKLYPTAILAAEDSTSFPKVTEPAADGGLALIISGIWGG